MKRIESKKASDTIMYETDDEEDDTASFAKKEIRKNSSNIQDLMGKIEPHHREKISEHCSEESLLK